MVVVGCCVIRRWVGFAYGGRFDLGFRYLVVGYSLLIYFYFVCETALRFDLVICLLFVLTVIVLWFMWVCVIMILICCVGVLLFELNDCRLFIWLVVCFNYVSWFNLPVDRVWLLVYCFNSLFTVDCLVLSLLFELVCLFVCLLRLLFIVV